MDAPVPEGADTVIRVEDTTDHGDTVDILEPEEARGENVRRRGEDMQAGEALIAAGTEIGPGEGRHFRDRRFTFRLPGISGRPTEPSHVGV